MCISFDKAPDRYRQSKIETKAPSNGRLNEDPLWTCFTIFSPTSLAIAIASLTLGPYDLADFGTTTPGESRDMSEE
jgi:hypothetical protein